MSNRARRLILWNRNPICHWCGVHTLLISQDKKAKASDNMATVDHLDSRLSGNRKSPRKGEERTVLSCYKCNHHRGSLECKKLFRKLS